IGQIRLIQKRYTDAEKSFRAALGRPDADSQLVARIHYGLALCLHHRGDAAKAILEFDQAIAHMPGVPEFHFWRGTARRAAHDEENAQIDFAHAADLAAATNPQLAAQARALIHR
ncbi:MAG TPA: tetratricopeptide repeat protein, partial [Anaerolineae bacterium]